MSKDKDNSPTQETHHPSASTTLAEKGSQSMPCSESKADLLCQSSAETGADEKTTTSTANNDSTDDNGVTTQDSSQQGTSGTIHGNENNDSAPWTAVWDAGSQAYYWWNMITYETTWENPYEKNKDDDGSSQRSIYSNYPYTMTMYPMMDSAHVPANLKDHSYTYQAYFNKRTGKFQLASDVDRLNPERMSIENRARRQMQYYFDVDAYTEQRNRERAAGVPYKVTKRHLTKKDIERFKKAKHEKKMKRAREWLCD